MSGDKRPLLGISVGDPGGIGPEITAKSLALEEIYRICRPLVISDFGLMKDALRIAGVKLELNRVREPAEGKYLFGCIDVLDMHNIDMPKLVYKTVTRENGRVSFEYIKKVIELALAGKINGTVTGPISKEAINLAGFHYAGHTEIYSDLTKTKDYAMMLADGNFRIVHVSTHVALSEAVKLVKKDRVLRVIHLTHDMLKRLDVEIPKIAVAGLNPHAGEGGLFGKEEIEEIAPAVEIAKADGMDAIGPLPADTLFAKAKGGEYDAVVAMYHDQGHVAMKTAVFVFDEKGSSVSGVNVTLGLPIIRTSVDHGVAFDKAGEGKANPQSMIQAIKMAAQLAGK